MSRDTSTDALVLATQIQGENNRTITLLSPETGVYYATLYGGAKSKMRSLVSPFNRGKIWLYTDASKHTSKITDFDVTRYHLTFRESLFKSWAATLAAEVVIKTKCAGSPAECWRLTNGFLDGMELSDENESRLGLIRFIWRYLGLLGVRPRTDHCIWCGTSLIAKTLTTASLHALEERAEYDETGNGFVCMDCLAGSRPDDEAFRTFGKKHLLGKLSLTYLTAVSSLEPKAVRALSVDSIALSEMKGLCYHLLEEAAATKLSALQSGLGIL